MRAAAIAVSISSNVRREQREFNEPRRPAQFAVDLGAVKPTSRTANPFKEDPMTVRQLIDEREGLVEDGAEVLGLSAL